MRKYLLTNYDFCGKLICLLRLANQSGERSPTEVHMTNNQVFFLKRCVFSFLGGALIVALLGQGCVQVAGADTIRDDRKCNEACQDALAKQKKDKKEDKPTENVEKAFGGSEKKS